MIKMIAVLTRRPNLTREQFRDHYENVHVPLIKGIMGDDLLHYVRNYTQRKGPASVGHEPGFDCVTELHFADKATFDRAIGIIEEPENARRARADEASFLDMSKVQIAVVETETRVDRVSPNLVN